MALTPPHAGVLPEKTSRDVIAGLRPEDFHIDPARGEAVRVTAVAVEVLGPEVILVASIGGTHSPEIMIRCPRNFSAQPGDRLTFFYDPAEIHLFDVASTRALPRPARLR
jgi:multiple sugar transport system ATP-binding protein